MNGIRRLAKLTRNVLSASPYLRRSDVEHEIVRWRGMELAIRSNSADWETVRQVESSLCIEALRETVLYPDDAILDLGAHIGAFSLLAAQEKSCRIFAFEPDAASHKLCVINAALNDFGDRLICHEVAVGGQRETVSLFEATETCGHTTTPGGGPYTALTGMRADVECVTLADAITSTGRDRCAFLKFDIEGAEFDMIEQAETETLQRVAIMAGELHFDLGLRTSELLVQRLSEAGFSVELFPRNDYRSLLLARRLH